MDSNMVLVGSEIHGFRTMGDLDVNNMMEEAKARWLRSNEIHAMLCNHKYFTVHVKPMNLPKSGTVVLFDRKMLRNFRKDGYNWKKKKDGKTVKEAHEHLKVGNVERIHVYYAHGEDSPTFVRRCYWLLDKSLEHIVLVHYRETQELQGSPATSGNSDSSSPVSAPSTDRSLLEESDFAMRFRNSKSPLEHQNSMIMKDHEQRLHEINTLDWDELLVPDDNNNQILQHDAAGVDLMSQYLAHGSKTVEDSSATDKASPRSSVDSFSGHVGGFVSGHGPLAGDDSIDNLFNDTQQVQDRIGKWVNYIIADSPGSVDQALESSISTEHQPFASSMMDKSELDLIFNIADVSPSWALSTEETKILIAGCFQGEQLRSEASNMFLVCGDTLAHVEVIQAGVLRCVIPPQAPGRVNLYLSLDGHKPISQVLTFEFCAFVPTKNVTLDDKPRWEEFQLKLRLARLLFSSSPSQSILSARIPESSLKEAKAFAQRTSNVSKGWLFLTKLIEDGKMPFTQAKDILFELTIQNRLQEWLLENMVAGCKNPERDEQGQGVIHLCAILGYTWAILPFSWSGLSMDYRDKFGWTALHWAAYYGREKMVAALLSVGAKPNLVTDPTSGSPGGCTAADLASKNGFDGLAAYLAEKALVAQFNDMRLAGNASGSLQVSSNEILNPVNVGEGELYLKDTLAAYRTAADAAARIQAAFREHSFKLRAKEVEASNPEMEARNIVAAMKIQHAFRNYETRKKLAAVARIQHRFRTWKIRREFLNKRRQAVKIQAVFRGYQVRKQHTKLVWSVGILEKAILRWRLKRKGLRGLQVQCCEPPIDSNEEGNAEEDFFRAGRKQAEERVERSVVKVQAMFGSKQAQEGYRRMKLEHSKAKVEYEGFAHPDTEMG